MSKKEDGFSLKRIVDLLAFVALVLVAVCLVLGKIFTSLGGLYRIAEALAYIVVAFSAFFYARRKKSIVFIITYIVALILVIVFFIWPLVG